MIIVIYFGYDFTTYLQPSFVQIQILIVQPDEPLLLVVDRAVGGKAEANRCDQSTQVILTRLRALLNFSDRQHRIHILMARLIATSTLSMFSLISFDY